MSRADNSKTKQVRVVFLVHNTSSQCHACTCKVSLIYSIWLRSYGPHTVYYMELSQGQIIQKPNKQDVVFFFHDTSSQCHACTCKVSYINIFHTVRSYGPDTVYYMELSQGQIIQKPNKQELSSLFMTNCLNVMHAPVKSCLLYGTKSRADNSKTKQARVVFLVHDKLSQCHACTCKVS